jgi:uncharacterized membrane protein YhdT
MSLLPLFQWCENVGIGQAIRASDWLFPVIEGIHLLGLCVIGGSILLVDMRLLGLGLRRQPVAELARESRRFLIGSLAVMLVTGLLLFSSEAVKCYYSFAFWFKMTSLVLAIIFTFTVHQRVTLADDTRIGKVKGRLVALVSLALWLGVGWGGRWIGFS